MATSVRIVPPPRVERNIERSCAHHNWPPVEDDGQHDTPGVCDHARGFSSVARLTKKAALIIDPAVCMNSGSSRSRNQTSACVAIIRLERRANGARR